MIVEPIPRVRRIVVDVWKPLAVLFLWDCFVTGFYYFSLLDAPQLPLTLFGTIIALFLGFRSNSAYQRWWEARTLWGSMINASRNLTRMAVNYLGAERELCRTLVLRQIAYVHALRKALRGQPQDAELHRFLSADEASPALDRTNVPNALLEGSGHLIAEARKLGFIDTILQSRMESVLIDIANAQGGMERIKNTPMPNHYRFLPSLFARLLCVLLPIGLFESMELATPIGSTVAGLMFLAVLQVGEDLADPFADTVHDVPLTTMCRTIEIDLLQSIGDAAPEPLKPLKGVLL